jgi:hypothetical protein
MIKSKVQVEEGEGATELVLKQPVETFIFLKGLSITRVDRSVEKSKMADGDTQGSPQERSSFTAFK